ncbi:MAG TPA: PQQ-binding-like beta-propeller repeat protein [Rhizomicrobium sp.]|jgi:outer membrane protein assembly factor BamB|nr:PQQ-binding-like beta-propeller repeat protein [Rhizomicrobium sp.]
MKLRPWFLALVMAGLPGFCAAQSVVTYHNSLTRHGDYKVPGLTLTAAAKMHLDTRFKAKVDGHVYAQPLYWLPSGAKTGQIIVATESNLVYALDAATGATIWKTKLAPSVPLSELPCGNISPDGITGTPVIDPAAGVVYFDALTNQKSVPRHLVYALSLADGSILPKWPLDVEAALAKKHITFSSSTQGERSALLLFGGYLYVNYGGNWGDCGSYNGTVIQLQTSPPKLVAHWATRANGGGIWAQGGLAGDGESLYATTGNTFNANTWSGGEAIFRLRPGLAWSYKSKDYFAPSNWQQLDENDQDLGGTEALPLDIAVSGSAPAKRVIAFGKDGNAYLADRTDLGGIGGALAVTRVSNSAIITAPAVYETQSATMVAFTNSGGGNCSGNNLTMLDIAASGSSLITVAWCAAFGGGGAPIITTTDGRANPIAWVVGAEGDNLLHGFNALTGEAVFSGDGQAMSGLHHFATILAAEKHLYIAADNTIYAFTFRQSP